MEHQELGEGKEHFLGFVPSGSSNPPSVNGNPATSRSVYKVTEGSAPGFDFSSEDILSSYEYNKKQNFSDGHNVAPSQLSSFPSDSYLNNSRSDRFRESRTSKPYANEQSQEDDNRYNEIVGTVERTMKKYADNLLKVLDGMSSRLMQLEIVNERLERSVGEMRADMAEDHKENGERFRMLEDHVHEVHRTIQILRDKQEIAEAQTELAKLQLARKESSSNFQSPEDKTLTSSTLSEVKQELAFQPQNVQAQLRSSNPAFPALPALPAPPQSSPSPSLPMPAREQSQSLLPQQQQPAQVSMVQQSPVTSFPLQQVAQLPQQPNVMLMQPYYPQHQGQIQPVPQAPQSGQVPHIQQQPPQPAVAAPPQVQNLPYGCQPQHIQNIPNQSSQHVQRPQIQQMPHLQSQLPPQTQMQPPPLSQQPHLPQQAQMRPNIYSGQTHGVPPEAFAYAPETGQHQTQAPYQGGPSNIPSEASMYNYGGPPQIIQPSSQGQVSVQSHRPQYPTGDSSNASSALVPPPVGHSVHGYSAYNSPPRPAPSPYGVPFSGAPQTTPFPGAYMRFPSSQQQYAHPSGNAVPNTSGGHLPSSHAFDDLVEQGATMGFSRDQVRVTIQRLTESGQPVDMNSVLDRLNNTPGPSQRGWYN